MYGNLHLTKWEEIAVNDKPQHLMYGNFSTILKL